ncbi:MAG: EamA family transporter RarD [Acidaminococcales bacterium]|jgi:chloramphenicol-sensitive protein RarD|nr:EamA family transporter RarD [Acidaminococcales bacterium]
MRAEQRSGLLSAILAFTIWGLFPVYWKLLGAVPADEILAHRILWSFVFMRLLVAALGMSAGFRADLRELRGQREKFLLVAAAAVLISANWFIFIWAVNKGRVLETSLGYYINPLVNVLLGVIFLRERMNLWQKFAIFLAALGVGNLAARFGAALWISLGLAFSMGLYGLCKKKAGMNAFISITIETLLLAPLAALYLGSLYCRGEGFWPDLSLTSLLLLSGGAVTAAPLILFANGANKLPLSTLGMTQYVCPTLTFLLGTVIYSEPFTDAHIVSFALIWLALAVFSLSGRLPGKERAPGHNRPSSGTGA